MRPAPAVRSPPPSPTPVTAARPEITIIPAPHGSRSGASGWAGGRSGAPALQEHEDRERPAIRERRRLEFLDRIRRAVEVFHDG